MKILLDECVPKPLAKIFSDHIVCSAQEMGWASKKNGDLIKLAEAEFDVFLTADQNISYQQNLSDRNIAILLLPTNRWPILSKHLNDIVNAATNLGEKEYKALLF